MFRRNIIHHQEQQFQRVGILLQLRAPQLIVHVGNVDFHLLADREEIRIAVFYVEVAFGYITHIHDAAAACFKVVDRCYRRSDQLPDTIQCQTEGIDGALQSLQKVDAHQALDTNFTALHGQVVSAVQINVLRQSAGKYVF